MSRPTSTTVVDDSRVLRPEFLPYLPVMDFLAELLGPRSEVVLHDTSDLSRSIVALTNGHVSGRSVGGPATDLVLKVLQNHEHEDQDFLANYRAVSRAGGTFRSSTFFIRDAGANVVGMLCVNIDDEPLTRARDLLTAITATTGLVKGASSGDDSATAGARDPVTERLSTTVDELALDGVQRIIAAQGVDPHRMTSDEKIATVRDLDRAGVFLLKGAVAQVASHLHVSEPTVYRYHQAVRREKR
ncbi:putative transcriptional regulator YheO [Curtobacterium flaccumfaciens]|uniref:Transcriptional regulator YheO n=1 Tax=Curtobacterium salicis TaxID=1779862 RepID=A0ABX0TC61_9MICO|nr:helix-turn-helix transcriptional regulator [Curtobacterium sp. WW7]NII42627.1 putative transcriptional regulator YheO [Curtobacterium sp. WW7]